MPDWPQILSRDGPAVWKTAYRLVGNRADADECFQDACLAALEVSRREEVRHWRPLLQRLVTARALDRIRQRRRRGGLVGLADPDLFRDQAPTPEQGVEEAELAGRLRVALARVTPRQAEAFCLHVLEGWSYAEIASHLSISINAVGVLLLRARGRLRLLLGEAHETRTGLHPPPTNPREEAP